MHHGCFSGRKNKERYNLECSYCVPKCPEVFLVLHNSSLLCEKVDLQSVSQTVL